MLDKLKILLNITDNSKDILLRELIDRCSNEAKLYTHRNNVDELETVIRAMCVFNYNRLGTEGLSSEDYTGVSYDYEASYPDSIMSALKALRKVRTIR